MKTLKIICVLAGALSLPTLGSTPLPQAELSSANIHHEGQRYEVVVDPSGQKVDLYLWKNASRTIPYVDISLVLTSENGGDLLLPLKVISSTEPRHYRGTLSGLHSNYIGVALKLQLSDGHNRWLKAGLKRVQK